MASLICWASGMLQVVPSKQVPPEGRALVLMSGAAPKLQTLMTRHAEYIQALENWYVPGSQGVKTAGRPDIEVQQDRLALVVIFNERLRSPRKAEATHR